MLIIWAFPNVYEVLDLLHKRIQINGDEGHRVSSMVCVTAGIVCVAVIGASMLSTFGTNVISPFLYFQF